MKGRFLLCRSRRASPAHSASQKQHERLDLVIEERAAAQLLQNVRCQPIGLRAPSSGHRIQGSRDGDHRKMLMKLEGDPSVPGKSPRGACEIWSSSGRGRDLQGTGCGSQRQTSLISQTIRIITRIFERYVCAYGEKSAEMCR